jgi:hypothetical protein
MPKTPNPCTEFACDLGNNLCVFTPLDQVPVPDDPNPPMECYDDVCIKGFAQEIYDENNLPKVNSCTDVKCMMDGAVRTPKPAGTVCLMSGGVAGLCDGSKHCVECNSASDCTADMNPCHIPTCTSGVCSYPPPAMTITAPGVQQQNGDCQKWVCHTDGNLYDDYDPTDPADDTNTCTIDTCVAAGNTQHAYIGDNMPCGGGHVCLAGHCGCNTVADCPSHPNETCTTNLCMCNPNTCTLHCGQFPDGCGNTLICNNGAKDGSETDTDCGGAGCPGCAAGKVCNTGTDCASGHCSRGICCDQDCTGSCQSCDGAVNGGSRGTCKPIVAGQDPYSQCAASAVTTCGLDGNCDGVGGCEYWSASGAVCGTFCATATSQTTKTCSAPNTCTNNSTMTCANELVCTGGACLGICSSDSQCTSGYFCNGTMCAPVLGSGAACMRNTQCSSTNCVDGVCCDTPCTGACQTCAGSTPGTCGPIAPGADPGVCDSTHGAGGCSTPPCVCNTGGSCVSGCSTDNDCGICQTCVTGTCTNVAKETQTPGRCDDGHGNCQQSCTSMGANGCGTKCTCGTGGACLLKDGEKCTCDANCAFGNCNNSHNSCTNDATSDVCGP